MATQELIIQECSEPLGIGSVCGVYCLRNTESGKRYVGSTINMRERWLDHIAELSSNTHVNKHLQNSWNKHGASRFVFDVLELSGPETLHDCERKWINLTASTIGWGNLFNASKDPTAPMRGKKHTDEAKAKIKAAMSLPRKGRCKDWKHSEAWFLKRRGTKLTDEHKRRIGIAHLGKKRSSETRVKLSIARRRTVLRKKGIHQLCLNLP